LGGGVGPHIFAMAQMRFGEVRLGNLEALVLECWTNAENETALQIAQEHIRPGEENVTFLFSGKLRKTIKAASQNGGIAQAFLRDMRSGISASGVDILNRFGGLTARVNFHNRQHEGGKSGADLGIIVSRPLVSVRRTVGRIETTPDGATGLLAQAKLGRRLDPSKTEYRWDGLTDRQVKLFRYRRDYSSLLLYRVDGQKQNQLRPFGWQLCKGYKPSDAQAWLDTDSFPKELSSSEIMRGLFNRTIGTDDPKAIKTIIDPTSTDAEAIEVKIAWPKGEGPPPSIYLPQTSGPQKQVLHQ
jgi:hypothetical protein